MENKKVLLIILDGWGHGPNAEASAITKANTPFIDSLYEQYPNAELTTFGSLVGLPEGQMGNSEVGHLNIGAGRIVYQELARINKAIEERTLHQNETLLQALEYAKSNGKAVHLMGLVSDGGVHSHLNHLKALCDITQEQGLDKVFIHAFTDGRDTAPNGGLNYIKDLQDHISEQSVELASVVGRYYAMDRDKRWERIKIAYDLLVHGKGEASTNILESIEQQYKVDKTDEFLPAISLKKEDNTTVATIQKDDVLICFNFRTDRPREISQVLTQADFPEQDMQKLDLKYLTMTRYDETFKGIEVLFTKEDIQHTIGELLSSAGKTQLRIAETEKYPHVTFFFNGGREEPFENERRIVIPSPKVATYDLQPEMSAQKITDATIKDIQEHQPDFICLNYANTDMVGHTGDFKAAMKAAETVDACTKTLIDVALANGYAAIIIADHGNADFMINEDGSPHTAHTVNPVPCFLVSEIAKDYTINNGKLADVAPTILYLMGLEPAKEMNGSLLIEKL